MFDCSKSIGSPTRLCTPEEFERLLNDTDVLSICHEIKLLDDRIQAGVGEKQEKQLEAVIDAKKKELPVFCFHATFPDHHRQNASAVPSGLVSIDLDDVFNPTEFFAALRDKAVEKGMVLAFITPSTHGLKLVCTVPSHCRTLEEALEYFDKELGIETYRDQQCKDLARTAFVVPSKYVLYRDDAKLFDPTLKAPEGFGTERQLDEKILAQQSAEVAGNLPEPPVEGYADTRFVDGIAISELIRQATIESCGKPEPDEGNRNNCLYYVTKLMRPFLEDDPNEAARVMPTWGLKEDERWKTIRSAHSRPIAASTRQQAEAMLLKLRRQKALAMGDGNWKLPEPPSDLPPVFREFAHVTPAELQPAVLMSLLPILGFFGTMSKANLAGPDEEPEWRTPSFITIISAPPASQKGVITNQYKKLTEKQRQLEEPLMAQLNRYNVTKKEADKPKGSIRLMPERLSMTSLSVQLENADGMHLLMFTPEIDTLKSSNGSGSWNDLSTIFRKAIDNDELGQIYVSGESHCCNVQVFLNLLIEAQPESLREFMNKRNVMNGLDTRCIVVELPDSTGCRKLKVKKMSEFEWKNVLDSIEYLQGIGNVVSEEIYDEEGNLVTPRQVERQVLSLPRTRKALERWGLEHQNHYLQTQENAAEDHYFRRAKMIGFHAAMVAYMTSRCRETRAVIDFALWVAEYTLQSQMLHFGQIYNSLYQKRQELRADSIIAINQISQFNLFDALPQEFTTADMVEIMQQNGRTLANPYNNVRRWLKNGMIVEVLTTTATKRWRKTRA